MRPAADKTGTGCRILVVDDEEDVRLLLEHEIRDLGHAVVIASDAKAAISEIEHRHFDIVITDIRMPGMDGIRLTEWIKDKSPETDVIIITGYASVDTAAKALRLGAFDYLMKPFGEIELVTSSINRAVEKRMLEANLRRSMEALQKSEEEARQWAQENALVAEVGRNLSSTLDSDEIQEAVLRWIRRGLKGEVAALLLPDDSPSSERSWKLMVNTSGIDGITAARQLEEELVKGMQAVSDRLDQRAEIQMIVNEKTVADRAVIDLDASKLESCLCVPLIVGGEAVGMVGVGSVAPGRFGSRNLGFLSAIANQAAVAINNTRLFGQTLLEKQRLETILTNMADGLFMLDGQRRVVTINPALERMLGLEAKEVLGRTPFEASSDSRLASLATLCPGGLDSPRGGSGGEAGVVEREVMLEASARRAVRVSSSVVTDAAERYLGEVMVVHDVTRERELEQMKSDFLANTSHELRTPLHSIKGFVKLLLDGQVPDPETQKEFLGIVNVQTEHLGNLVDDLLDVSRIDAGHLEVRWDRLSVGRVIHNTVQKLSNLAKGKGIEFRIVVPAHLPAIEGDEERLTQVLTNLLHNAVKFSPGGGEVTVRAEVKDHKLLAQVTDYGIGIPEEAIPHLFERFYRVDSSMTRNSGGSGLGLYISRQIVEAHGGQIWVESKLGEGSTFGITLPLNISSSGATNRESPPDARQEGQPVERSMK